MRDFLIQQLLPVLAGPLQVVLMAVAAWVALQIRKHVRNQELASALATLSDYSARAVADVYQTTVAAAKASGKFDQSVAHAAKDAAVEQVKALAPTLIKTLRDAGENTDATIASMIEKAVVDLKKNLPATPPAAPNGTVGHAS